MFNASSFRFPGRVAALSTLIGVASALALGGAMVVPTVAAAAYTGTCSKTISAPTDPASTESSMSAGQTLCLNTGTYDSITESEPNYFNASGTAGNPIVVTSAPGQTATIDGSDWLQGAYVTYQYLNLDVADVLGDTRTSAFVGCPTPASLGVELDASDDVLQDNNIYESVDRDELIGVNYAGSSTPVVNDVISHNNLGPAGQCKQLDHLIYDDYSTGLQITQNWFFDDPYGYGVQLYVAPTNTTITGNVFDDVLDGIIAASSNGGNTISHNVGINLPNVSGYASGMLLNCYQSGIAIASNNAICSAANGFGSACGSLQITGTNPTLAQSPFVGGECSDNYTLASNAAATSLAGYGLWNGQGPPSPNPATSYPKDPPNPGPNAQATILTSPVALPKSTTASASHGSPKSRGSARTESATGHGKHHKKHARNRKRKHRAEHNHRRRTTYTIG